MKLTGSVKDLASVTMIMSFPADLAEVRDIQMVSQNEELYYTVIGNKIRIVFSTLNTLNLNQNDVLATIKFRAKTNGSNMMNLDITGQCELGDYNDNVIGNVDVELPGLIAINPTGITTNEVKAVNVYPNPAKEDLTIVNAENAQINIYDAYGKEVLSVEKASAFTKLNISNLATGTYFVKIITNNGIIVKKVDVMK